MILFLITANSYQTYRQCVVYLESRANMNQSKQTNPRKYGLHCAKKSKQETDCMLASQFLQ